MIDTNAAEHKIGIATVRVQNYFEHEPRKILTEAAILEKLAEIGEHDSIVANAAIDVLLNRKYIKEFGSGFIRTSDSKAIEAQQLSQKQHAGKIKTRREFDLMSATQRQEFLKDGGILG
ncbi:hypothetical protein [Treponema primitia]|uniref:hypothetical protein n=1 Tax=Treponema primitia TaxID=88058 RepID=UPI000255537A|nr:hypothetical protein [Treponema primitia]